MRDDKSIIRGTAAKREVRELRRAMGTEALSVINDHEDAIGTLAAGLHKAQIDVSCHELQLENLGKSLLARHRAIEDAAAACQLRWDASACAQKTLFDAIAAIDEWRDRNFLGRLRWLFTGR